MRIEHRFESADAAARFLGEAEKLGAVLVPAQASVQPGAAIELVLELHGEQRAVTGSALQVLPGHGVVVAIPPAVATELGAWAVSVAAGPPEHFPEDHDEGALGEGDEGGEGEDATSGTARRRLRSSYVADRAASGDDLAARYRAMSQPEKMQAALHGSRELRGIIMRDSNRSLHVMLLKNPHLRVDEVQAMARIPSLSPEAIVQISRHDTWSQDGTVCTNLVRNPKTPPPIAVSLMDRVPRAELRRLATGQGVREHIARAAAKRLQGSR